MSQQTTDPRATPSSIVSINLPESVRGLAAGALGYVLSSPTIFRHLQDIQYHAFEELFQLLVDAEVPTTTEFEKDEEQPARAAGIDDIYYLSVYQHVQRYGGPEEGDWYYRTIELVSIDSFFCPPETRALCFSELWSAFCAALSRHFGEDYLEGYHVPRHEELQSGVLPSVRELNDYGEGYTVRIERIPGELHDTRRPQYE